jgi:hypothetical protein
MDFERGSIMDRHTETMMWYVERHGSPALRSSFATEELAQEYASLVDRVYGREVTRVFMAPVIEMIDRLKPVTVLNREHPADRSGGGDAAPCP